MLTGEQRQLAGLILERSLEAQADAGDFATIADTLNERSIEVRDPTEWTYGQIRERLGEVARRTVADTLRAAGQTDGDAADAHLLLLNGGLRLDLEERQQTLDQLAAAAGWPQDLTSAVKALGVRLWSPASENGLEDPDAEQVRVAWTLYRLEQRITNAAALLRERISAEMLAVGTSAEHLEQTVLEAWSDAENV